LVDVPEAQRRELLGRRDPVGPQPRHQVLEPEPREPRLDVLHCAEEPFRPLLPLLPLFPFCLFSPFASLSNAALTTSDDKHRIMVYI
jgi:hypothetical protein